jgi:superfamily II DNA or RNA helicase
MQNLVEKLTVEVLKDDYFIKLNDKAFKILAKSIFYETRDGESFSNKELLDSLRFSDILSNSKNPIARNKAYQLITLLNGVYYENPFYRTFAHSVLAKLGNFPAIQYLSLRNDNNSELPFVKGIEKNIKELVQAVPDTNNLIFTDAQYDLYQLISNSKSFSFSGPTSMGKSFIIKSFIRKSISNSPPENIAILVPTRALINQFSLDLNKELKEVLEIYNYKVVTNSNISELPSSQQQQYIFVLTPERLISYLSQKENPSLGYLFVDEAHKLAAIKDSRAITSYTAISRALKQNSNLNLYFSSPNVSNPEVFLKLFNKDEKNNFRTIETPVSQNLFFIDLTTKEVIHYTDNGNHSYKPDLIKDAKNVFDILYQLGKFDNNIVYCSSRFHSVDKASELYKLSSNRDFEISKSVKKAIRQIKTYIHKDYYLAEFLKKGIAYHFGNLPQTIRNKIETLFKNSEINFIFCTSTLLEGVNLPAKNVFILDDYIGKRAQKFSQIDFWNLAGRAGRLKHELSGNIFCIKENEGDWSNTVVLDKVDSPLVVAVENYIDNELIRIEKIILESKNIKYPNRDLKEILNYLANIINIDTLQISKSNYKSEIINKLIQDNKDELIKIATEKNKHVEIPVSVLVSNQSIKVRIQNNIYKELRSKINSPKLIKLPLFIDTNSCNEWLLKFYDMFDWGSEEAKMFSSPDTQKQKNQLRYYALLMTKWISGTQLSVIIDNTLDYYKEKRLKVKVEWTKLETYDGSAKHNNIIIGDLIENIEYILRYLFEKYFNCYYAILSEVLGEDNAGVNWATFLEYGTRNTSVIALQNLGLSRHSANYIFQNHQNCLLMDGDKLVEIDVKRLEKQIDKEDIEYEEISSFLF